MTRRFVGTVSGVLLLSFSLAGCLAPSPVSSGAVDPSPTLEARVADVDSGAARKPATRDRRVDTVAAPPSSNLDLSAAVPALVRLAPDFALVRPSLETRAVEPFEEEGAEEPKSGEPDLAELAQKSNNPLSDVWLMLFQNDYTYLDGDLISGTRQLNSLKFQPVMPIPLFEEKWNLIVRPVFSYVSVPLDDDIGDSLGVGTTDVIGETGGGGADPFGRTNGFGDTALLTLLGPNRLDGFVWGGGATQIFPTAEDDVLGQKKYQAGPAAIALRLGKESGGLGLENWNLGFLAQHWWSYAGDDDRDETSLTDVQYFLNWRMNATQLVGMTPNIRYNWKADGGDRLSLPVGLGTIGLVKIGPLPVRWGLELQYYVVQPDPISQDWNIKFFFSPIIPNLLKKKKE